MSCRNSATKDPSSRVTTERKLSKTRLNGHNCREIVREENVLLTRGRWVGGRKGAWNERNIRSIITNFLCQWERRRSRDNLVLCLLPRTRLEIEKFFPFACHFSFSLNKLTSSRTQDGIISARWMPTRLRFSSSALPDDVAWLKSASRDSTQDCLRACDKSQQQKIPLQSWFIQKRKQKKNTQRSSLNREIEFLAVAQKQKISYETEKEKKSTRRQKI